MQNRKGKLFYTLMAGSILPLFIYALLILVLGNITISRALTREAEEGLIDVAHLAIHMIDSHYPGDYHLEGDSALRLYKGDFDLTTEYHSVDFIKEETGVEATLFYRDTRVLTTLTNWDGKRLVGTAAPDVVLADVLATGQPHFYDNVIIDGDPYFAYYSPLFNSDGKVTGMLFVGKPVSSIQNMIQQSLYPLSIVGLIALLISAILTFRYSRKLSDAIVCLKRYFAQISAGQLDARLDDSVRSRKDELSEIGTSAASMQHSLRKLIDRDSLTGLYNRRSGEKKLDLSYEQARTTNSPFTVVLCDIDLFKKVNDTYGHESGDIVLKNISLLLKETLRGKGYAIRWGGEEFLLVYEGFDTEEAYRHVSHIRARLADMVHHVSGGDIHVSMTYGMICDPLKKPEELIKAADDKLYIGKNNGRDRIVT